MDHNPFESNMNFFCQEGEESWLVNRYSQRRNNNFHIIFYNTLTRDWNDIIISNQSELQKFPSCKQSKDNVTIEISEEIEQGMKSNISVKLWRANLSKLTSMSNSDFQLYLRIESANVICDIICNRLH